MFDNLIETNPKKQRSAGGTVMSVLLHSCVIGLVVVATASAGERAPQEAPEKVEFVEPPRAEAPPPEPVATPAPPSEQVALPPQPKGFQQLVPPLDVPDVIPRIDLSRRPIDEADFTGVGARGGKGDGLLGVPPAPVVDVGGTYLPGQVERAVVQLPGRGAPGYPSILQARGVTGRVIAQFVVDTTGLADVASFTVLETDHELFSAAVRRALPAMRFIPAEVGGRKVKQLVQQPFVFDMR